LDYILIIIGHFLEQINIVRQDKTNYWFSPVAEDRSEIGVWSSVWWFWPVVPSSESGVCWFWPLSGILKVFFDHSKIYFCWKNVQNRPENVRIGHYG